MRRLRRGRPAGLLAALGLGGCIAAASASQADAFDPAPPEGRMGQLDVAGGGHGLPAARSRHLTDAVLDAASDDASGRARAFMYPVDDFPVVFNPPPPAVFAGGNAPGSPSLDAMLDHMGDD